MALKPLVFDVLVALSAGERHGWDLVRELRQRTGGERILPANFYRTLRTMLGDGLIEDAGRRRTPASASGDQDERRRYFRLTPLGESEARAEARRLQALMSDARTRRLLKTRDVISR